MPLDSPSDKSYGRGQGGDGWGASGRGQGLDGPGESSPESTALGGKADGHAAPAEGEASGDLEDVVAEALPGPEPLVAAAHQGASGVKEVGGMEREEPSGLVDRKGIEAGARGLDRLSSVVFLGPRRGGEDPHLRRGGRAGHRRGPEPGPPEPHRATGHRGNPHRSGPELRPAGAGGLGGAHRRAPGDHRLPGPSRARGGGPTEPPGGSLQRGPHHLRSGGGGGRPGPDGGGRADHRHDPGGSGAGGNPHPPESRWTWRSGSGRPPSWRWKCRVASGSGWWTPPGAWSETTSDRSSGCEWADAIEGAEEAEPPAAASLVFVTAWRGLMTRGGSPAWR